eukprot:8804813-Alexandrium_andersonii.AAC.1
MQDVREQAGPVGGLDSGLSQSEHVPASVQKLLGRGDLALEQSTILPVDLGHGGPGVRDRGRK